MIVRMARGPIAIDRSQGQRIYKGPLQCLQPDTAHSDTCFNENLLRLTGKLLRWLLCACFCVFGIRALQSILETYALSNFIENFFFKNQFF